MAKFDRHAFVLKGLIDAIGKQSDYWVMLNADSYYEKGILNDDDMELIFELIEKQYEEPIIDEEEAEPIAEEEPTEPIEEVTE